MGSIDELHSLTDDLEDEGHPLADRFRDAVNSATAEFQRLVGGANELEVFMRGLVATLTPVLESNANQIVADLVAEIAKFTEQLKLAAPADDAPAVDAASPALAQVEPPPAPAQG